MSHSPGQILDVLGEIVGHFESKQGVRDCATGDAVKPASSRKEVLE